MSVSLTAPIRVEKGEATQEELAALAVLLLSRTALAGSGAEPSSPGTTSWRPHAFHAPHSWQRS
ncbi:MULTISPECIES: acyl-CoA carboxylase epsilon subunit [unclassified Streptomyces]|uniref:acyl-CoA carboxylase epsilon subunit n=1 Tax=unclassified Streptomyces TaxID=2593676 RepID=UPI0011A71545|nr:acyl-CoA carboxylase epsilon subunit [Streptomyces sp. BK340]TVZ83652.1 acyl-CoA carboxylase epsilon subunit-like protein [Streptomyces sp. BK340]